MKNCYENFYYDSSRILMQFFKNKNKQLNKLSKRRYSVTFSTLSKLFEADKEAYRTGMRWSQKWSLCFKGTENFEDNIGDMLAGIACNLWKRGTVYIFATPSNVVNGLSIF